MAEAEIGQMSTDLGRLMRNAVAYKGVLRLDCGNTSRHSLRAW